jgi:hypothetical protein
VQGAQNAVDAIAGVAEDPLDSPLLQLRDQVVAHGFLHRWLSFSSAWQASR